MAKHPRKKQKVAQDERPLGSASYVDDDVEKDDEERRLESLLFGKEFRPRADSKGKGREVDGPDEGSEDEGDGDDHAAEVLRDEDVSCSLNLFTMHKLMIMR